MKRISARLIRTYSNIGGSGSCRRIRNLARHTLRLEDIIAEALPVVEQAGKKRLARKMRNKIKEKLEWEQVCREFDFGCDGRPRRYTS